MCAVGEGTRGTGSAQPAPQTCRATEGSVLASRGVCHGCSTPSPVTGSSEAPGVQRHFMLTERFSAGNLRLNKLGSSVRSRQRLEGEELALSCTARSWCTLDVSQVRGTSATSGHVSLQGWGCASPCARAAAHPRATRGASSPLCQGFAQGAICTHTFSLFSSIEVTC